MAIQPWAPPLILPVGGWDSFEHLEAVIRSYLRVRLQVTTPEVHRIDLTRGELLISTPGGDAWMILIPTEKHTKRQITCIEGWPV